MIREEELLEAIAECQGERNPNANTCIKLASYYTILSNMKPTMTSEPTDSVRGMYSFSGSEFSQVTEGMNTEDVMQVMDELMDTVEVLMPKLYRATIEKIRGIKT